MKNARGIVLSAATVLVIGGCATQQEIAKSNYTAKNYPQAIAVYKESNMEEPNNPANVIGLANSYYANRQYGEAIEWYLKYKALNPNDTSIACNLGTAYYYTGQYPKALTVLEAANNINPLAQQAGIRGSRIRAMGGVSNPESPCVQVLNTLYEKTGRYDIAISNMKKKIDSDPRQSEPFVKLSSLYYAAGMYDDSITAAKRGIDLIPNYAEAHQNMGLSYWKKTQYVKAIGSLRHTLELNPNNSVAALYLAKSYEKVRENQKAIETLRKSRMLTPSVAVDAELARLLYRSGIYSEGAELLNRVIEKSVIIGVGIRLESVGGNPIIQGLEKNSPALRAGLRVGDRILQADQQNLAGLSVEEVVEKIRGELNIPITLTLKRGEETIQKQLIRESFYNSDAVSLLALRSLMYRKLGNTQQAQDDARKANDLSPKDAAMAMGASAYERGDMAGVLRYLSAEKEDINARVLEAAAYAKGANTAKALELLREVTVQDTDEINIPLKEDRDALVKALSGVAKDSYDKGVELAKSNQPAAALDAYANALLLAESEADANMIRTEMFKLSATASVPLSEEAHRHVVRGEFYVGAVNYNEALNEFRKGLVLAPFASRLYFNTALVEAKLERYSDALRHMNLYIQSSPNAPDTRAAKDEMIKWEMLIDSPKEYPYYEGSVEAAITQGSSTTPEQNNIRGVMQNGR